MLRFLLTLSFSLLFFHTEAQKQKVWIDADTGNEVDDVYAIVRLLYQSDISVEGISSAHFNNPDLLVFDKWNQYDTKNISTIDISQQLNEHILSSLGIKRILCCKGADRQIGRAWGGLDARPSAAVDALVKLVKSMPEGEKLDIICLGALTNIASAVILHPEIIPHIRCYILAAQYDSSHKIWNKNEFNVRNDLNAFDYLMELKTIDLTIMPTTTALPFRFEKSDTFEKLSADIPAYRLLTERWEETEATSMDRILWDLALVEAYLCPNFTQIEYRNVPPENGQREIKVCTKIDSEKLKSDFWKHLSCIQ